MLRDNFDNYKFRASQVWNLFSEPKTKTAKEVGEFSESCKTWLHGIFLKEKYGFEKQMPTNKYFQKGILCEEQAIMLVNSVLFPNVWLEKNTIQKENEWITGECDNAQIPDTVFDTKCCWDLETFHYAEPTKEYEIQLNCYGLLYGAKNLLLCYCLINTPEELLSPFEKEYDYERMLPLPQDRLKWFKVDLKDNFEALLAEKVTKAREYLNNIKLK